MSYVLLSTGSSILGKKSSVLTINLKENKISKSYNKDTFSSLIKPHLLSLKNLFLQRKLSRTTDSPLKWDTSL